MSSISAPAVIEDILEIDVLREKKVPSLVRSFAGAKTSGYLQASCSVYPEKRIIRNIMLDSAKGKEGEFIIAQLKEEGLDPDEYAINCLSSENGEEADLLAFNKKNVLVCGAKHDEIVEVQNKLVSIGVYPNRLEIGTIGTIGILKRVIRTREEKSPVLFLEMESESTNAIIVGSKGVEMARRIDCGARQLAGALKEEMNLKDEAAAEKILLSKDFDLGPIAPKILRRLLRELQSSIGFYEVQTGHSVGRVHCLKQGSKLGWMEYSICDLLSLTSIDVDLVELLQKHEITFRTEELAKTVDITWVGLLALVLDLEEEAYAS